MNLSRHGNSDTLFLKITNNTQNRVIINNLQLSNVRSGLRLEGSGQFEVHDSTFTGNTNPALRTGVCIDVQSPGAIVRSSTISNCGEGARIAADNVFFGAENPSTYETDKNTFIGNATGIHQISGTGNKWPFNSISGGNGIVVDGGVRPVMRLEEGNIATLTCTQPEGATAVTACEIQFDSLPESGGEVEVYKTIIGPPVDSQGKDYIARCSVVETNKCVFDSSNAAILVSNIYCGVNSSRCDFTVLQTDDNSSIYTDQPFKLVENISTIIIPTGEDPLSVPSGFTEERLYIEDGGNSGGDAKLEPSGGGGGQGGAPSPVTASSGVALKTCRFTTPDGMEFMGSLEMWWWLVLILPAPLVLRRRG